VTNSELTIELDQEIFEPGDTLVGRYRMPPVIASEAQSVEIHVYWRTEGKGDEDGADEHHETRSVRQAPLFDGSGAGDFSVDLPAVPLSYDGLIVKIIWFLQIRVFTNTAGQYEELVTFQLGRVAPVSEIAP
jgi:hypothetical protein